MSHNRSPSQSSSTPGAAQKYSRKGNVTISCACVNVSIDIITGSEQKAEDFYERIWSGHGKRRPNDYSLRMIQSMDTRCKLIVKACTHFLTCFYTLKPLNKRGISADDEIRLATTLLNYHTVEHPQEDVEKTFCRLHPRMLLHDLPKSNHENSSSCTDCMQSDHSVKDCKKTAAIFDARQEPGKRDGLTKNKSIVLLQW